MIKKIIESILNGLGYIFVTLLLMLVMINNWLKKE